MPGVPRPCGWSRDQGCGAMFAEEIRRKAEGAPRAAPAAKPRRAILPWSPANAGPYRLPKPILDRLVVALAAYRNRDAALGLAVFLGRFWSTPARLMAAFPIDRRALTDHAMLGLTEARVRGALATLEAVGFLDRAVVPSGSRYRPTEQGLHRKPVLWRFGADYGEAFAKVNGRGRPGRTNTTTSRRLIASTPAPRMAPPRPETSPTKLAQKEIPAVAVLMGDQAPTPLTDLDAALERLGRAIEVESGDR